MRIDIYHKYDFSYNENEYKNNLKEALASKGYNKLSKYVKLFNDLGVTSYETCKSYYSLRRVVPLDVLAKLCDLLELNATKIMFPKSIPLFEFNKPIANDVYTSQHVYMLFLSMLEIKDNIGKKEVLNKIKKDIDELTLYIARYNYSIQKYNYANVSNLEITDIGYFSERFLVKRLTKEALDWDEFRKWNKTIKSEDFITEFYNKYEFIYNDDYIKIIKEYKDVLPLDLVDSINNILAMNDRIN